MTKHFFFSCLALALVVTLSLSLLGCGEANLFAYQEGAQSHTIRYETEAGEHICHLTLGEGGEERDFTLTYEAGVTPTYTIGRTEGTLWLKWGTKQVSITPPPIPLIIVSLFCIPDTARVTEIKKEGDTRVATCMSGDTIYTLRFEGKRGCPTYISTYNSAIDGDFFAIYVN